MHLTVRFEITKFLYPIGNIKKIIKEKSKEYFFVFTLCQERHIDKHT